MNWFEIHYSKILEFFFSIEASNTILFLYVMLKISTKKSCHFSWFFCSFLSKRKLPPSFVFSKCAYLYNVCPWKSIHVFKVILGLNKSRWVAPLFHKINFKPVKFELISLSTLIGCPRLDLVSSLFYLF